MKQQESEVNYVQDLTHVDIYIYKMVENSNRGKKLEPVPWRMAEHTVTRTRKIYWTCWWDDQQGLSLCLMWCLLDSNNLLTFVSVTSL